MKHPLTSAFFGLSTIVLAHAPSAFATPPAVPTSMGSLGDSITAGAIADYSLESWKKPSHILSLLKKLSDMGAGRNTEAFERKDLSWTVGHAQNFKKLLHAHGEDWKFTQWNGAVSGNASRDVLHEQLPRLLEWSRKTLNQGTPDYVTLLIGPNDICGKKVEDMVDTAVFKKNVHDTLSKLFSANPEVRVLISEIPDVERVWRIARDHRLSGIKGARTCGEVWKKMPFCANLLTVSDESDRRRMRERAESYNAALGEVVAEYGALHDDQVRMARGVYGSKFELGALSADCFHPNQKGHQMLTDTTWASTWWAADEFKAPDLAQKN
ncbi:MAG TPA: SGNH/GDSL hydrolase family protein [Bdellovibrionota bacterium]|nr:SGNH/GDSL hydrolase family protein [Bdellovibrionota bacterium]